MIKKALCFVILVLWTVPDFVRARHQGSRRQAVVCWARGWWRSMRRAYVYGKQARHRYRRSQSTPDTILVRAFCVPDKATTRYTGKRRVTAATRPRSHRRRFMKSYKPVPACTDLRTADGLICIPANQTATGRFKTPPRLPLQSARKAVVPVPVPVDPWQEYMTRQHRNNTLTLTGQEGPHQYVTDTASVMGRNPDPTGESPSTEEFVHTVQGWGDHYGHHGSHRRGGVQRTPERLQAQLESLLDLVSAGSSRGGSALTRL